MGMIDGGVLDADSDALVVDPEPGLNDEPAVLVFIQQVEGSASSSGFDGSRRHVADHSGPAAFGREAEQVV